MEYAALFIVGSLGSIGHCVGMCGGFVSAYSLKLSKPRHFLAAMEPHLFFNSGRLFTYVFLGLLFGLAGQTLSIALGFAELQAGIRLVAGIVMILIALQAIGLLKHVNTPRPLTFLLGYFRKFSPNKRLNLISSGAIMGLMPCGLVYAAGASAATAATLPESMLQMAAFGLGTLPTLLLIGLGMNKISVKKRLLLFRSAAVLVIFLGISSIYSAGNQFLTPKATSAEAVSNCLTTQPAEAQ
ncbi:MAG: sulfite exporter TauE/SafE family protein [Calditrichia bacterium]